MKDPSVVHSQITAWPKQNKILSIWDLPIWDERAQLTQGTASDRRSGTTYEKYRASPAGFGPERTNKGVVISHTIYGPPRPY